MDCNEMGICNFAKSRKMGYPSTGQRRKGLGAESSGGGTVGDMMNRDMSQVTEFRYSAVGTIPAVIGSALALTIPTFPDSYLVVTKLIAASAGTFFTQIVETGSGSILMDAPIAQANLFGIAQRPNYLRDPLIVSPSSQLLLNLTNGIAGANAVQIILEGYRDFNIKTPPVAYGKNAVRPFSGTIKFFQYSTSINLVGGASQILQTRIQSDSNFIVRKYLAASTGNFSVRFSNGGSQSAWSDNLIQRDNICGTAQYPAILSKPRLVPRNSSVQTEITDLSGAPNAVQIVFEGAKLYV